MPQIFKIGSYTVYFWSNEGKPLEPIHVHIAEGRATAAGTKVWITSTGKTLLAKNSANLSFKVLRSIMRMIEANSDEIIDEADWRSLLTTHNTVAVAKLYGFARRYRCKPQFFSPRFSQSPLSAQIRVVYQRTPVLPPAHPEYLWSGNGDEYWPW